MLISALIAISLSVILGGKWIVESVAFVLGDGPNYAEGMEDGN